jgi:hypothetical protein
MHYLEFSMVVDPFAVGPNAITFNVLRDTMGRDMTFFKNLNSEILLVQMSLVPSVRVLGRERAHKWVNMMKRH